MNRRYPGLVTVVVAGLVLAACGGQPQHSASVRDAAAPTWHRLVQCARQNGMPDLPDPTIDDQGQAHFPGGTPSPPPSVVQACQAIYDQLPAQARGTGSGSQNDPAMMRQFAQCMRRHGIDDWPDPDAQGKFHMPPSLGNIKRSPRWQPIRAACNACTRFDPSGHIETAP